MPSEKRKFGDIGEKIAVSWLKNKGFSILDRNYLKKWGEIDIVAKQKRNIHFIEVKSVSCDLSLNKTENKKQQEWGRDSFRPEENVHPAKLKRLHRTIESYLIEKNIFQEDLEQTEGDWQLDVAVVYLDTINKLAKVEMLENIVD